MQQGSRSGRLIDGGGGPTVVVCMIVMAVIIGLVSLVINMDDFLAGIRPSAGLGTGIYGSWQPPVPPGGFAAGPEQPAVVLPT